MLHIFKFFTVNDFTTQQKCLRYLQDEYLGNITVQPTAFMTIVFPFKNIDTQWKGISENTVTVNETCFMILHTKISHVARHVSHTAVIYPFPTELLSNLCVKK